MTITPDPELRLKRLYYRSCHRGNKESDIILSQFAKQELEGLSSQQLNVYERLLDEDDANIWDWLVGKCAPPTPEYQPLIDILKGYGLPSE